MQIVNIYRKSDIPEHLLKYFCPAEVGLEPTPEEYVDKMVGIFREVRRVLKSDGTLWLNMGDCYCSGNRGNYMRPRIDRDSLSGQKYGDFPRQPNRLPQEGLKDKDLVGIPWRVAFALQADGWWLRQDIIWHKPNPMPESVTDRCTKAHEYVFLMTKSVRYYYNDGAIREPDTGQDHARSVVEPIDRGQPGASPHRRLRTETGRNGDGRNKRSVWTVATQPYPGAHFATFPPKLIEPCIKAGARAGDMVLDLFMGSGTTLLVARELGCQGIGIEINEDYCQLARKRLEQRVIDFK